MKNVLHKKIRGIISLKFCGEGHIIYREYRKNCILTKTPEK